MVTSLAGFLTGRTQPATLVAICSEDDVSGAYETVMLCQASHFGWEVAIEGFREAEEGAEEAAAEDPQGAPQREVGREEEDR